jgi:hypothetical protein
VWRCFSATPIASFDRQRTDRNGEAVQEHDSARNYVRMIFCDDEINDPVQHSMTFRARPPRAVSLYRDCMSRPVWYMVRMTWSSETL